jgi:hypothetical protein
VAKTAGSRKGDARVTRPFVKFATQTRPTRDPQRIARESKFAAAARTIERVKLLLCLTLACAALCAAPLRLDPSPVSITVRILNPAQVPARDLAAAERVASSIFGAAGVVIEWVDCEATYTCGREPGPSEVWLHILEKPRALTSRDALGFALLTHEPRNDGGYAAVSWQSIRRISDILPADRALLLGSAVAHELGHFLLASHAHSHDGIMAAHFGVPQIALAARGELLFNDAQASAIRRRLMK